MLYLKKSTFSRALLRNKIVFNLTNKIIQHRQLLPHLKEIKTKGHKAYLRYNRLIINNETNKATEEKKVKFHGGEIS